MHAGDEVPLTPDTAAAFVAGVEPDDVAVMISATSGTPLPLRREGLAALGATDAR